MHAKKRGQDRKKLSSIQINTLHRYASSPSLHDPLVWDYTDKYTHTDEMELADRSSSAKVLRRIGLRRLEGQRSQKGRKEQGLGHVAAALG
jgi:hypothetical protein